MVGLLSSSSHVPSMTPRWAQLVYAEYMSCQSRLSLLVSFIFLTRKQETSIYLSYQGICWGCFILGKWHWNNDSDSIAFRLTDPWVVRVIYLSVALSVLVSLSHSLSCCLSLLLCPWPSVSCFCLSLFVSVCLTGETLWVTEINKIIYMLGVRFMFGSLANFGTQDYQT